MFFFRFHRPADLLAGLLGRLIPRDTLGRPLDSFLGGGRQGGGLEDGYQGPNGHNVKDGVGPSPNGIRGKEPHAHAHGEPKLPKEGRMARP